MWRDVGLADGVEEACVEMEKVEEGIVKLISKLRIKNLVMGAVAREMVCIESNIAEYVVKNADASCQIWFLHKGKLIKTRYEQVMIKISSGSNKEANESRYEKDETESVEAPRKLEGRVVHDELCERIEQPFRNVDNSNREAFDEPLRHRKAEKKVFEAACQVEDTLIENKQEIRNINDKLVAVTEERNSAFWQKSSLEIKVADLETKADQYKEKLLSAVELLRSYKTQRDNLQLERDRALRANTELSFQAENSRLIGNSPGFFSQICYLGIKDATRGFHPSSKIIEEGNHKIFKGVLRGTEVAIKVFSTNSSQGASEYRKEVEVLSRLRHPNIVSLIGACPEAYAIVHEYLPNGSLEDRLSCKGNSSPLPWQARVRIAAELCSALVFLHSTNPHSIVHGDLKPSNIHLDANFVSKLSNFATCYVISPECEGSAVSHKILPRGTFAYLDPEFRTAIAPEPTPQLDVYSFGIILLKLLTGREAWGIAKEVRLAVRKGQLNPLLDSSAGDWPYLQTRQLTHIALRCAEERRKDRPYLESELLKVLESIRASSLGIPLSPRIGVDPLSQAPSYYICPISQDIMQDPQVAADGFTYELKGIQGWLLSGHNTSPMTNLKLAHTNLVPNRALRSAIQEWLRQS